MNFVCENDFGEGKSLFGIKGSLFWGINQPFDKIGGEEIVSKLDRQEMDFTVGGQSSNGESFSEAWDICKKDMSLARVSTIMRSIISPWRTRMRSISMRSKNLT
jgi:hypothetical protein